MQLRAEIQTLIQEIYRGAASPQRWEGFLRSLREYIDAESAVLSFVNAFRDLFKHTSGFGQNNVTNTYEALKAGVALPVGAKSFSYKNANYGLMRVLSAGLHGTDVADHPGWDPAALTASYFLWDGMMLYGSIGVAADCMSHDPQPTIQYNFPDGGNPGYLEPNRQLSCGGFGWFMSSNDLANILSNLRLTENLLSSASRNLMEQSFLGYFDPAIYGAPVGAYGAYYMHGGDWLHGAGEAHTCAVAYPIQVQVGLILNSERGLQDTNAPCSGTRSTTPGCRSRATAGRPTWGGLALTPNHLTRGATAARPTDLDRLTWAISHSRPPSSIRGMSRASRSGRNTRPRAIRPTITDSPITRIVQTLGDRPGS